MGSCRWTREAPYPFRSIMFIQIEFALVCKNDRLPVALRHPLRPTGKIEPRHLLPQVAARLERSRTADIASIAKNTFYCHLGQRHACSFKDSFVNFTRGNCPWFIYLANDQVFDPFRDFSRSPPMPLFRISCISAVTKCTEPSDTLDLRAILRNDRPWRKSILISSITVGESRFIGFAECEFLTTFAGKYKIFKST
ncbi:hypothetical protein PAPHI01_2492 [Pancytospora philotis]|nr:hypothetical protein PAPHI01_2492 [Pancytospora philotis]